jgi:hypothetical protein
LGRQVIDGFQFVLAVVYVNIENAICLGFDLFFPLKSVSNLRTGERLGTADAYNNAAGTTIRVFLREELGGGIFAAIIAII